jgi:hypothetical protein
MLEVHLTQGNTYWLSKVLCEKIIGSVKSIQVSMTQLPESVTLIQLKGGKLISEKPNMFPFTMYILSHSNKNHSKLRILGK